MSRRIGILTGGGDCPGLNGVIRAVTLHADSTHGWEVVGIRNGFEGLYEQEYVDLAPASVAHVLARGGTMLGSSNRANPFAYPVKLPDGRVEIHDVSARCMANLAKLDLHGLIVVGGDGTMSFAKKFIDKGAKRIVGVPKTIDNDLEATDYTVGFQTAVEVVVGALERLQTTAESHERIMIVEVMGRYAGWIALVAGLAGGAHVVLIPEIEYDVDAVCAAFHKRHGRGVSYSIVVVAEGARPKGGGHAVVEAGDATKQEKLGGAGQRLADAISARTEYEVRTTVLGHVQRGGAPCAFDRELATRYGVKAVDLIADGKFGHVAALDNGRMVAKPIETAVKKLKLVDPNGELVKTARAIGINLGD
ncbi:MAG: 6-phosphofructokinase [Kofleriaceae bacterium]|jgi:phosphofructokinase-like protein|nr:6-phosphofructokinase [Kofleriaceae bacterium]MBP6841048.1 6-phosphofructokinase [Kofleriaceae bacterium]MBP9203363.1 6-phosphofructokinase [Kofleriaceae bacterium]